MVKVYFLLGGNLGDRLATIWYALDALSEAVGPVVQYSSVYETEPWGVLDQPTFLNQTAILESSCTPLEILAVIHRIEHELKRERIEKWGTRTIDVDILFYGDQIYEDEQLSIPHPALHERNFTLVPLLEMAPKLAHPRLGKTIEQLYEQSPDPLGTNLFKAVERIHRHN